MRSTKLRLAAWYGAGLVAVMLPIAVAILLAEYKSLEHQRERASSIATEILSHAHKVTDQLQVVFKELSAAPTGDPCSERNLNLMRKLVIQSNLLIDVGYIENEHMVCSSFGRNGYAIGPPSYVSTGGYNMWTQVEHPLLAGSHLLITSDPKTGFFALIHEGTVLDVAPDDGKLSYGVLAVGRKKELFQKGLFDQAWLKTIGKAYETSFFDGSRVVAWKRSDRFDYAAYVAIPGSEIDDDWKRVLWFMLPIAIGTAIVLAFVVTQLVRLQGAIPAALRYALKHKELFLVYQPVVDLRSGTWVGVEALLRWQKSSGEFVSPDIFIPVAERYHLIEQVTEQVIALVEADAAELLRAYPDFHVALNLSAQDFCNPAISERLRAAAAKMRVHPRCLHVEATERVFLHAEQTRKAVETLRMQGHSVSIDDFGTGYSSLSYLTELELDCLKIDKCFVGTIGQQAVTSHVIAHIIEMAKSLGLQMIAEGIETQEQADYLRAHGVQFGQGWLYAKPMGMAQLAQELARQRQPEAG
ncbi:EAL domain-containing protein [Rhodoferax saidenbachensis]|uniref:cyclic-guanylate-specific phosphodiesterase n=1 Tax=Rhodoferax saidenbachensis TaxID=1484693 RepID=A0ABU1ZKW1_9BURK|nr:EAL domain-containing protein [Rhodoferax saidenbachensis]MDR7306113.1 sensor c-di-GMP phosphodiesterase-like protein [Rhodoferax saidenbachensis]